MRSVREYIEDLEAEGYTHEEACELAQIECIKRKVSAAKKQKDIALQRELQPPKRPNAFAYSSITYPKEYW